MLPPLVLNKKKSPADIVYGCRSISALTSTIALAAASSSLQVSMTVLSQSNAANLHTLARSLRLTVHDLPDSLCTICQTRCSQTRSLLWCRSEVVQSGYFESRPKYLSSEFTNW